MLTCLGRAFTGAWIETRHSTVKHKMFAGRAFTGAWIETSKRWPGFGSAVVAPSQARGLKQSLYNFSSPAQPVAPSQARGLKHIALESLAAVVTSRLHRRVD